MPDVPAELREFLMTGITPEEWDKYIGTEELDYDQVVELPSDSLVFDKPVKLLEFDSAAGKFVDMGDNYTGPTFRENDE